MNLSTSNSKGKIRKYITGFLWFLFFLFLFDRSLFYLISHFEVNFYSESDYEHRFASFVEGKKFSTLILGTSRTYEGIHPVYFEKILGQNAYKEGFQGKGPKYNYYFYQLYKKYAGIPRVVIYGVDYFINNIESDPRWLSRFETHSGQNAPGIFSHPLLLLKYKAKIDNFYNNILIKLAEKQEPGQKNDALRGFMQMQKYTGQTLKEKKLVTQAPAKYKHIHYFKGPGREGDYFVKLLKELKKDNVTVVLVALPDYWGTYKSNFQRVKFLRNLRLLRKHNNNVHIANFNHPKKFPLDDPDMFIDGGYGETNSHLSYKGAKLLCERLLDEIKIYYE